MIQISRKNRKYEINLIAFFMGKDLCIAITGGDIPHLGAVTIGSQYFCPETVVFEHHKENVVTEMFGNMLRREYTGNFAICCGIHIDNITKQEIEDVIGLCREMAMELCNKLKLYWI